MTRVIVRPLILFIAFFSTQAFSSIDPLIVRPKSGKIEFKAIGNPKGIKISGVTDSLTGKFTIKDQVLSGETQVELKTLDTGIEKRNEHMKDKYLEVGKYPVANLIIDSVNVNILGSAQSFSGKMNLHGNSADIHSLDGVSNLGSVILKKIDGHYEFHAEFSVLSKDFKIETPSFAGISVADKVDISVDGILDSK